MKFNIRLTKPTTRALRPVIPDNAWGPRITAAAGTRLATPYSRGTVRAPGLKYLLDFESERMR